MATSTAPPIGDSTKSTAPYVPFKSFLTALDRLAQGHPPQIDTSFWHGFSGGLQRQMINCMRFFGLIGENGEVSKELDILAKASDRRELVAGMLRACYPVVMDIGIEHATPNQFNDALRQYNVAGTTLEKARSFFLQAARFAGLSLSPGIQQFSKKGASPGKRKTGRVREDSTETNEPEEEEEENKQAQHSGSSRTIQLRGGGTATLSFNVDVWSMTPEDQQFVFEMIRKMTEYEQAKA